MCYLSLQDASSWKPGARTSGLCVPTALSTGPDPQRSSEMSVWELDEEWTLSLTVLAVLTPARSQPSALKPPLFPQVWTKSGQPCPELPACHTQPMVPGQQGPESGDCPDCKSSASPGIHLKDNVRLRETSGTLASIWRGASGVWAFASGSRLLGVETKGLCQRQLWKPATGREAWCWAEEETRARGHARGPLLLRGLRKTLILILAFSFKTSAWIL